MKALIRAFIALVASIFYYLMYKWLGFEIAVMLAIGQLMANDIINDIEKDYKL